MAKMRQAGFDMLFIGIESFSASSLLETAKLQNPADHLVSAIREVQSYGFVIVAGLIFGFDSDGGDCFDKTLDGLEESSLLSGDPSLLTALPGTPLYRRMKLSGRLHNVRYGLGGYKYQTNIRYLLPRQEIIEGYKYFVRRYNDGAYQYARLRNFFTILEAGNFIPLKGGGYGSLRSFARMVLQNRAASWQMCQRIARFCAVPNNLIYALKGLWLVARQRTIKGRFSYFQFWLFAWTNSVLKYQNLSDDDFDIESVPVDFDIRDILPAAYAETADEKIPKGKIASQLRATQRQLTSLIEESVAPTPPAA